jgi:NDP-sugar pyrophosphorylase family protein
VQAVILAGGLGTRLGEITRRIPKPMVPVAGVPYLGHQLRLLREQAITDVLLLTGYLGEQIEAYFGDGSRFGLSIRYAREAAPQGTGGALRDALPLLNDAFLLLNGDSYLPIEYGPVWQHLLDSPALAVAVVYDNHADTTVPNNIALDAEGFLRRYDKDASGDPDLRYVDAGVRALRRAAVAELPSGRPLSLEKEVYPLLLSRRQMRGFVTAQRFYDIGTPDRLRQLETHLQAHFKLV